MKRWCLLLAVALLSAQATDVEITAEPHHHLTLLNDHVRVFNVEVLPGSATLMHWHRRDYFYMTLGATQLSNEVEGKPPVTLKLQDGETRFSAGPFAHLVRVSHVAPFRNVTVELLQDEKLHRTPSPWKEDRGLSVLQGGTAEILFVKDAVRATEFELQPGGVIPKHHHAGPHLTVALTDYEVRSDMPGKAPVTIAWKTGESKWFPGGYSHTVTNIGAHPARFVTLEFP